MDYFRIAGAKKIDDFPVKRNHMESQLAPKSHINDHSKGRIRHHQKTGGINDVFHLFISFVVNHIQDVDCVHDHRQTVADQKSNGDHQLHSSQAKFFSRQIMPAAKFNKF